MTLRLCMQRIYPRQTQALMEAPLCLDDREERQEFSRRAAKMFDETMHSQVGTVGTLEDKTRTV